MGFLIKMCMGAILSVVMCFPSIWLDNENTNHVYEEILEESFFHKSCHDTAHV